MAKTEAVIKHRKDGSLWAKGQLVDGKEEGYWEYFHKDGWRDGSGYFTAGKQTGEWTRYDKDGKVLSVREFK